MEQKTPQFPFYYRDFMHAVRRFTDKEIVEYLFMLFEQADSATGSIDAKIFDEDVTSERVREKFEQDSNGYFNVRMRDILHKRQAFKESRIKNLSGKSHKGTHKGTHKGDHVDNDNDNDNDNGKGKGKRKQGNAKPAKRFTQPLTYPYDDPVFVNRWQAWKDYKSEQFRFTYKPRGEQAALKQIGELSNGDVMVALAIIERSMANGWRGLFAMDERELKQSKTKAAAPAYDELIRQADAAIKPK